METEKIQTFNADITLSIKSEKDLTGKEVKRKIKSMVSHDEEFRLNLCQKVERVDNNE